MTLRVAHALNPRFSHISDGHITLLLEEARQVVEEHFGIEVSFTAPEQIGITELFALRPDVANDELMEWVYDFKKNGGKPELLVADLLARI